MKNKILIIYLLFTFLSLSLFAKNDTGCRDILKINNDIKKFDTEFFIIIDQTTYFEDNIKKNIIKKAQTMIKEGTKISIYRFSQFSKNKYVDQVNNYLIEKNISEYELDEIKKSKIKKLTRCLKSQKSFVAKHLQKDLSSTFRKKDKELKSSDILVSLQNISENAISNSKAKNKIVFLISDMLENSVYTSFYKNGTMKSIDKKRELKLIEDEDLFGDFDNANIYVIGAGIVDVKSDKVRDNKLQRKLVRFWKSYFKESNGNSREINYGDLLSSFEN